MQVFVALLVLPLHSLFSLRAMPAPAAFDDEAKARAAIEAFLRDPVHLGDRVRGAIMDAVEGDTDVSILVDEDVVPGSADADEQ